MVRIGVRIISWLFGVILRNLSSFIVCLYKGKGDALDRGNYQGLNLTEQVMKVLEHIADSVIRSMVSINDSQFGFIPGKGTTDEIGRAHV